MRYGIKNAYKIFVKPRDDAYATINRGAYDSANLTGALLGGNFELIPTGGVFPSPGAHVQRVPYAADAVKATSYCDEQARIWKFEVYEGNLY